MRKNRSGRSRTSGTGRCRSGGGQACAGTGQRPERIRPRDLPALRRWLCPAGTAGRRHHPGRQAVDQQSPAQVRRHHRRDELRAQAPLGDQGRTSGQSLLACHCLYLCDFRCAGRPRHGHRLRPYRGRPEHLGRSAGDPQTLRHRGSGFGAHLAAKPRIGNRQTRRPEPGTQSFPVDRPPAAIP
ncbi:hypothetical protein D3C71_1333940 [compost metagenome]